MTTESQDFEANQEDQESVQSLEDELESSRAEAEQWLDKYRRGMAEFSNYRKRIEREREQQSLRMRMDLMRRLLPIADDFHRAMDNVPEDQRDSGWVEGVQLIANKVDALLRESGVEPIEALGEPFDPFFHDALMQGESDEYPEGTVAEEIQKGYLMGDQVLRPTLVKVSLGPGSPDQ